MSKTKDILLEPIAKIPYCIADIGYLFGTKK